MTVLQNIEYHRNAATQMGWMSPGYFHHIKKAAELTREWRKTNTLRVIDGQK